MRKIKLTQGKYALVSNTDYTYLNQWKWCANFIGNKWYAVRGIWCPGYKTICMHRLILERMGFKDFKHSDHRDGNGLNNQRRNLRPATQSQNIANRGLQRNNTSGFKGVYWIKPRNRWRAGIKVNRHNKYLGYFKDPVEAARAYNDAVIKYFGKFAKLNKI